MRQPQWPDTPTIAESGLPGFTFNAWVTLMAPARTPKPVIDRLYAEMQRELQVPEVRGRLESFGGTVTSSTPEEMRDRVAREVARWTKVVEEAHIERQ